MLLSTSAAVVSPAVLTTCVSLRCPSDSTSCICSHGHMISAARPYSCPCSNKPQYGSSICCSKVQGFDLVVCTASCVLQALLTGTACNACLIADRLPAGTVDLILAYCHNSLNDTSLQEWVPYLKKQEVAIVSASPMSMGLMTTKVCILLLRSHTI